MAGTPKLLCQGTFGSSNGTLGTVPAGKSWTISMIHVANCDSAQRTFRMNHVPSAGSVAVSNRIVSDAPLPVNDFVEFGGGMNLATGDTLQGLADSASVVSYSVYGIEY